MEAWPSHAAAAPDVPMYAEGKGAAASAAVAATAMIFWRETPIAHVPRLVIFQGSGSSDFHHGWY